MTTARKAKPDTAQFTAPFPGHGIILDLAGRPVDTDQAIWRLNDPTNVIRLNWALLPFKSNALLAATTAYLAQLVRHYSNAEVRHAFDAVGLLFRLDVFVHCDLTDMVLPHTIIGDLIVLMAHSSWKVYYVRRWYEWCCDQGHANFCPEAAFRMREYSIPGNPRATAVRSSDPEHGPLIDTEIVALLNALRASRETNLLTKQEHVALWLCIALGCNPQQYALLRHQDFERLTTEDANGGLFMLRVPRMKKRHAHTRTDFKQRKLIAEIGCLVEELIAEDKERLGAFYRADPLLVRPLFAKGWLRTSVLGTPLHEFALGMTSGEFTAMISGAVKKLAVISPRTGCALWVTTRRLRYTFATRLVRAGASQRLVAESLDHSDLQHVQCYFDLKSDIVESLDRATALTLGPLSQAFLGHLVRSEGDAIRGERPSSRIYRGTREDGKLEPVGTCGSFSFCGFSAPVACYTCTKFQAWLDGPHEQVLNGLLEDRKQREERGLDPRMVALNDVTIHAVSDVIARVSAIKEKEALK